MPARFFKIAHEAASAALRAGRHVRVLVLAGEGLDRLAGPTMLRVEGLSEPVVLEWECDIGPPRVVALFFEVPKVDPSAG